MTTHTEQLPKSLELVNELAEKCDITDEDIIQDMYLIALEGIHNRNSAEEIHKSIIKYIRQSEDQCEECNKIPMDKTLIAVDYSIDDVIDIKELHDKLESLIRESIDGIEKDIMLSRLNNFDTPDFQEGAIAAFEVKAINSIRNHVDINTLKEFLCYSFDSVVKRIVFVGN